MKLNIADVIVKRRRELDLTQEELASRIGVSSQAVSNWERSVGYPDLLLVPPLANALGVTTDELFGIGNMSDDEILEKCKCEFRQVSSDEKKEILIQCYHRYPNTYCVLGWITWIIYREYKNDEKMVDLAKKLGRRIFDECTDTDTRMIAAKVLSFICDDNEAYDYIDSFSDCVLVRPNIIGRRLWDKGDCATAQNYFDLEMVLLFRYIFGRNSYCSDSPEKTVKYYELRIDLMKTLGYGEAPDGWLGNFGLAHIRLASAYFACGNKELGYKKLEDALEIYEKWYSHSTDEKLSVGRLSLFDSIKLKRNRYTDTIVIGDDEYENCGIWETSMSEALTREAGGDWFDTVKSEERYKEIVSRSLETERKYNIV
ncbi:MAG: helix-turn-helix domain-containing protein [Clostridia bacterium]|nr:helix-turn-helix domain-containing protein [Clostridia bacterium]